MRRNAKQLVSGALVGATVLAGAAACGAATGEAGPSSTESSTSSTSRRSTSSTSATSATRPPTTAGAGSPTSRSGRMTDGLDTPVVLQRAGGVGGVKDRLTVNPDGSYVVDTKGKAPVTRRLSESQFAAILDAVQAADLPSRAQGATASVPEAQPDRFRYQITAQGATITTSETTASGQVRQLLDVLQPLFSAPAPTP